MLKYALTLLLFFTSATALAGYRAAWSTRHEVACFHEDPNGQAYGAEVYFAHCVERFMLAPAKSGDSYCYTGDKYGVPFGMPIEEGYCQRKFHPVELIIGIRRKF